QARNAAGTSAWSAGVTATPWQWAQVSAGTYHTCAVTVAGRAYCWGNNGDGQLGDGTSGISRRAPVPVDTTTGLTTTNVASISAGYAHTCAVTIAGQAYCWGANWYGQVGDGTTGVSALVPTPVDTTTGLAATNVASISA